ncbi:hypothetical protein [Sedimentimonas flavescens]|uniref:hypothetical protein n=1 Tax=Sedimentimonas flavescens TaxID=2851012 RepID=UPI001F49218A
MIEAGESKTLMSTKGTLIRAYMAGAILALAVLCIVLAGFACRRPIAANRMKPRRSCQKTRREIRRRHHSAIDFDRPSPAFSTPRATA